MAEQDAGHDVLGEDAKKNSNELFASVGKAIAKRWKKISAEDLAHYKKLAEVEMERYRAEMAQYQLKLARERRAEREQQSAETLDQALGYAQLLSSAASNPPVEGLSVQDQFLQAQLSGDSFRSQLGGGAASLATYSYPSVEEILGLHQQQQQSMAARGFGPLSGADLHDTIRNQQLFTHQRLLLLHQQELSGLGQGSLRDSLLRLPSHPISLDGALSMDSHLSSLSATRLPRGLNGGLDPLEGYSLSSASEIDDLLRRQQLERLLRQQGQQAAPNYLLLQLRQQQEQRLASMLQSQAQHQQYRGQQSRADQLGNSSSTQNSGQPGPPW